MLTGAKIGIAGKIATITIHGEDRKSFRLFPIPEKHGALVDVKELLNDKEGLQLFKGDFRLAFDRIIERANTVVPAEGGKIE